MELRPLSDIIQEVLSGFDDELKTVGAAEARKEMDGRSRKGAARQFTAATGGGTGLEGRSGVRLIVSNTTLRKPTQRRTGAGLLKLVVSR